MGVEFLGRERAVVDEELQVEGIDVDTGAALTRRVEHHLIDRTAGAT